ncbi:hypothetical protein [Flavobacterium sp. 1]|uniref:hypothetical protein n=1 Tax=Flavobacterium sp. 1 TaxID=2035200 RepID=UPI0018E2767B|nr:hypothetical protein [Flavobacterium sp. 1]
MKHYVNKYWTQFQQGFQWTPLNLKLHIPILLLHECKVTSTTKTMTQEYKDENFDIS